MSAMGLHGCLEPVKEKGHTPMRLAKAALSLQCWRVSSGTESGVPMGSA